MPKKKMTNRQIQDQSTIIQSLTSAGWKKTDRGQTFGTANMEYQNKTMNLEVDYDDEDNSIYLSIYDRKGQGIDLIICFNEKLREILNVITSFQDSISPDNYKDHIRKIKAVCPSTYLDSNEEPVLLIDDQIDSQLFGKK